MVKADELANWKQMEAGQDPLPHMGVIPYKSKGSRYGACGIRIDGSPAFIDAVLSNLKTLIDGENHCTRLELSRSKVNTGFKELPNADRDAECCYIRLHMRGREAAAASVFFDRHLAEPTRRFAAAQGVEA